MLAAEAPIDAESRAKAPLNAESRVDAPLDAKSSAESLCHPGDSDNDLRRDIRDTGMDGRGRMSSEVAVQRIWKQLRHFLLFLCFLLFSSLLFIASLDLGPVQMASARVFTICQWRWSFPVCQIRRRVAIELYRSVVGLMGLYDCVRSTVVWLPPYIPFHSFLLYWLWQPWRSAPKEGDNETVTRDPRPGKRQCI